MKFIFLVIDNDMMFNYNNETASLLQNIFGDKVFEFLGWKTSQIEETFVDKKKKEQKNEKPITKLLPQDVRRYKYSVLFV